MLGRWEMRNRELEHPVTWKKMCQDYSWISPGGTASGSRGHKQPSQSLAFLQTLFWARWRVGGCSWGLLMRMGYRERLPSAPSSRTVPQLVIGRLGWVLSWELCKSHFTESSQQFEGHILSAFKMRKPRPISPEHGWILVDRVFSFGQIIWFFPCVRLP